MELDEMYAHVFECLEDDDRGIWEFWWGLDLEKRSPEAMNQLRLALLDLVEKGVLETLRQTDSGQLKKTAFASSRFEAQVALLDDVDKVNALVKDFYWFGYKVLELKSGRKVSLAARLLQATFPGHE